MDDFVGNCLCADGRVLTQKNWNTVCSLIESAGDLSHLSFKEIQKLFKAIGKELSTQ